MVTGKGFNCRSTILAVVLSAALVSCGVFLCGLNEYETAHGPFGHTNMALAGCVSNSLGILSSEDASAMDKPMGAFLLLFSMVVMALSTSTLGQSPSLHQFLNTRGQVPKTFNKLYKLYSAYLS